MYQVVAAALLLAITTGCASLPELSTPHVSHGEEGLTGSRLSVHRSLLPVLGTCPETASPSVQDGDWIHSTPDPESMDELTQAILLDGALVAHVFLVRSDTPKDFWKSALGREDRNPEVTVAVPVPEPTHRLRGILEKHEPLYVAFPSAKTVHLEMEGLGIAEELADLSLSFTPRDVDGKIGAVIRVSVESTVADHAPSPSAPNPRLFYRMSASVRLSPNILHIVTAPSFRDGSQLFIAIQIER